MDWVESVMAEYKGGNGWVEKCNGLGWGSSGL